MNADPLVMRYFLSTFSAEETDRMLENNRLHFERHGLGFGPLSSRGRTSSLDTSA
jgi:hypothetical protein